MGRLYGLELRVELELPSRIAIRVILECCDRDCQYSVFANGMGAH